MSKPTATETKWQETDRTKTCTTRTLISRNIQRPKKNHGRHSNPDMSKFMITTYNIYSPFDALPTSNACCTNTNIFVCTLLFDIGIRKENIKLSCMFTFIILERERERGCQSCTAAYKNSWLLVQQEVDFYMDW